ncbi:Hypothetical protein IALB_2237 [Ignavibacterium album JCM 16511]|uniref:Uncharacterized protein n=1 Tax=Ignavibacterium album (strain DSM 19864 / JCM 16511 / NBRC 101810 / Mat9-16) TaxID=945713 RepID=I0ALT3_IGNAJ|nr:hypothetical protein [Ignavibacterium album]AFH49940.1 Hypothetical protein IALB_2237 [Ignavibacterium album JCM 16511]
MFKDFDLSKSAKYLFAVAIILLIVNIVIDFYITAEKPELKKKKITFAEADSLFKQALRNYDISEKFLSVKRNKKNPSDSVYSVKVYSDVPISLLLLEIENLFSQTTAKITSEEESIGGKTIAKIILDNKPLVVSEFVTDKNISREKGRIGFVVFNIDYSIDNSVILNTPEQIIFLVTPSEQSKKFINKILSAGKRYSLLLNDDIQDLNFKMNESYPIRRNKKSVENLFKYFPSAAFIAIDDKSDLFESSIKDFLVKELDWRKAFYVNLSRFDLLDSYSSDAESAFKEMIKSMNKNESRIILIDSKNLNELLPVIPAYRKIGYKFVSATELLK